MFFVCLFVFGQNSLHDASITYLFSGPFTSPSISFGTVLFSDAGFLGWISTAKGMSSVSDWAPLMNAALSPGSSSISVESSVMPLPSTSGCESAVGKSHGATGHVISPLAVHVGYEKSV